MANEVILPMLGETMNEGTIVSWQKVEGETVRRGEVLFTVESDKATLEVEAPASGVLRKILAPAGTAVPVLTVIGWIADTMDEPVPEASGAAPAESTPVPPSERAGTGALQASPPVAQVGKVFASPRARRVARERGLDLSRVRPSGSAGRIVERDVLSALVTSEARSTPIAERVARELGVDLADVVGTGRSGLITRQDVERAALEPKKAAAPELQPLTRTQRLMAERMTTSFTTAPHFYLHVEVNARALLTLRQELLAAVEAEAHVRLTVTDILIRLCALALVKHPIALSQWTPDGLRPAGGVNIGVATDTPGGLLVPVIRDVDRLSLAEIAHRRTELVDRARAGKSTLQDFEHGAFTLTNLGMFRVDSFEAILNPPQAAILAVGRIKDRPVAVDGQLAIAPTMNLVLSVDHRVLDGAAAARLLDDLVELVETPSPAAA